jgi:hypothetical protein
VEHTGREQVRRTVAQQGRYFDDEAVRAEVRARARSVITESTRVVVAHSLGTVLAYEVLATLPRSTRLDLVTLGSPLGQHAVVGQGLQPAPEAGVGQWPAAVRHWTNVTAVGDPVADGTPSSGCPPGSWSAGSTTATGPTTPSRTSAPGPQAVAGP